MKLSFACWGRAGCALVLAAMVHVASAQDLDLSAYQDTEGAIVVHAGGTESDPYFALKALLLAQFEGLEARRPLRAYVAWLMRRQLPDGRFMRSTRTRTGWVDSRRADADDSLLALWLEALLIDAGSAPLSPDALVSYQRAEDYLETQLFDARRGIYKVFANDDAALSMDNIEILAIVRRLAWLTEQRGNSAAAARWQARARGLTRSIQREFSNPDGLGLRISTQALVPGLDFYPHRVAPVFAWLNGFPDEQEKSYCFAAWLAHNDQAWRDNAVKDYPWGLVALYALKSGAHYRALRWLHDTKAMRGGPRWNVLEESVFQVLQKQLLSESAR